MLLRGAAALAAGALLWYVGTDLITRAFYDADFRLMLMTGIFAIVVQLGVLPITAWAARRCAQWLSWVLYLAVAIGYLVARVNLATEAPDWLQEILASLLYFLVYLAGLFVIPAIAGPDWRAPQETEEDDAAEA